MQGHRLRTSASATRCHWQRSSDTAWPIDARIVATVGIVEGPGGVEEEQVVLLAVVGEPEVPHPGLGRPNTGQPFTPEEAMQLMNERWKAMNSTRIGMVIREA